MATYQIEKEFHFSAAHHLDGLPKTHPCSRQHGHNYVVIVRLASETLDQRGFVVDYSDLGVLKQYIDAELDHRDLNEVFDFNPTAENIACYLYHYAKPIWPQLVAVSVKETPKTIATYHE